ncbi:MAG: hypothetical protein JW795_07220 [Chitinivibrionales bacterium]|nr:hypothetical protein [Chitinivibrionales bacterium]
MVNIRLVHFLCFWLLIIAGAPFSQNQQPKGIDSAKSTAIQLQKNDSVALFKSLDSIATVTKPSIIKTEDDILIEDESEELILKAKPQAETKPAPMTDSLSDSTARAQKPAIQKTEPTAIITADSVPSAVQPINSQTLERLNDSGSAQPEKPKIVSIEQEKSVNFANNLKDYRSPKKALFLSLLLPGLGQAYAKNTWKSALYGLVDVGLIAFSVKKSYDGNQKRKDADRFAITHYSNDKFLTYYSNLYQVVKASIKADPTKNIDSITVNSMRLILGYDRSEIELTPNISEFYARAKDSIFVQGWDDCVPFFDQDGFHLSDSAQFAFTPYKDSTWWIDIRRPGSSALLYQHVLGFSQNRQSYNEMMNLSNRYYRQSLIFMFVLLANHIVSAADAYITARAYNFELLEKQSMLRHLNLYQEMAMSGDDIHTSIGVTYRF